MPDFALDLTRSHFIKPHGDITVYGSWYGEDRKQCLAIIPTYRTSNIAPLVIPVNDAWKWNPEDPDALIQGTAQLIFQFLLLNGMDAYNSFTHQKVMSIVHDHLGDLMEIPPFDAYSDTAVVAEVFETDRETGKTTMKEITERV